MMYLFLVANRLGMFVTASMWVFPTNDDNNTEATQFSEILSTYNLTQLVQDPTHKSGYTLDLVITRALSNFLRNVTMGEKSQITLQLNVN